MDDLQQLHIAISAQRLLLERLYVATLLGKPEVRIEIKDDLMNWLDSDVKIINPALVGVPREEALNAVQVHIESFLDGIDGHLSDIERPPA